MNSTKGRAPPMTRAQRTLQLIADPKNVGLYSMDIERKMLTEERMSVVIPNLKSHETNDLSLAIAVEMLTKNLKASLFGCDVNIGICPDASASRIEFIGGNKDYVRKVYRGSSTVFECLEQNDIVLQTPSKNDEDSDAGQLTSGESVVYVPLVGKGGGMGVVEIHGLLTAGVFVASSSYRDPSILKAMIAANDFRFKKTIKLWRVPSDRIPLTTANDVSSSVATTSTLKNKEVKKKIDFNKNHYHIVCGKITEVVFEKNNVPYYGGPRYNVSWEDGFNEEAILAADLLKLYANTPQSLGCCTELDESLTNALLQIGNGAGIVLEKLRRKEILSMLRKDLNVPKLSDTNIVERSLDVVINLVLGAREAGMLSFAKLPEVDHSAMFNHISSLPIVPNKQVEAINLVTRHPPIKPANRSLANTYSSALHAIKKSKNSKIPTIIVDNNNIEWVLVEIPVPHSYSWRGKGECHRLFIYLLRSKHPNTATGILDVENFLQMSLEVSKALTISWEKELRRVLRKDSIHELETLLPSSWSSLTTFELCQNMVTFIAPHLKGANAYIGLIEAGARKISFISANATSNMTGVVLNRGEGVSFAVIESNSTMIILADDLDKSKNIGVGTPCKVAYPANQTKRYYDAVITANRGHQNFDIQYTEDKKREAGVNIVRLIPMQKAFSMKQFGTFELPYVCVPLRNRDKGIGCFAFDTFKKVPIAPYDRQPESGLISYLENVGRIIGATIDMNSKRLSLKAIVNVGKNVNADISNVAEATFDAIFDNIHYTSNCLFVQVNYESFVPVEERGYQIIAERSIRKGGLVSKESKTLVGNFDPLKSSFKTVQKRGKNVWLVFRLKVPGSKTLGEGKIFILVLEPTHGCCDVDLEFLDKLQKLVLSTLHNLENRVAHDRIRHDILRDVKSVCEQWPTRNRHELFSEIVELIQKCYFSANLYIGKLDSHAEEIKYTLASRTSHMKGKVLSRYLNQGISFDVLDNLVQRFVSQASPLSYKLHHFGAKELFEYPYLVIPLKSHLNSVLGVLCADNCHDITSESEQGNVIIANFFYTVATYMSNMVKGYGKIDAISELQDIALRSDTFLEGIQAIKGVILKLVPYALRICEIEFEPVLVKFGGLTKNDVKNYLGSSLSSRSVKPGSKSNDAPSKSTLLYGKTPLLPMVVKQEAVKEDIIFVLHIVNGTCIAPSIKKASFHFIWQGNEVFSYQCDDPNSDRNEHKSTTVKIPLQKGVEVQHVELDIVMRGQVKSNLRDVAKVSLSYHYMVNTPMYVVEHMMRSSLVEFGTVGKFSMVSKMLPMHAMVAYSIDRISIKGLAKADLIGSSDPFVSVRWNNKEAGRTSVLSNNLNPVWTDLNIQLKWDSEDAEHQAQQQSNTKSENNLQHQSLLLEVWDMDHMGQGDFLGCLLFKTGDDRLQAILSPDEDSGEGDVYYDLVHHPYMPVSKQSLVQGKMHLYCTPLYAADMSDVLVCQLLGFDVLDQPVIEDMAPIEVDFYESELEIVAARDLNSFVKTTLLLDSNEDKHEHIPINPYVCIHFNGDEVGRTSTLHDVADPQWEEELFTIRIRSGLDVSLCELKIEVFDMNLATGKGKPLGQIVLRNKKLSTLLAGLKKKIQWFDLEDDDSDHVLGQIQLSGRKMFEAGSEDETAQKNEVAVCADLGQIEVLLLQVPHFDPKPLFQNVLAALDNEPDVDCGLYVSLKVNGKKTYCSRLYTASIMDDVSDYSTFWEADKIVFRVPNSRTLANCILQFEIWFCIIRHQAGAAGGTAGQSSSYEEICLFCNVVDGEDLAALAGQEGCRHESYEIDPKLPIVLSLSSSSHLITPIVLADQSILYTNASELLVEMETAEVKLNFSVRAGPLDTPDMVVNDGRVIWFDILAGSSIYFTKMVSRAVIEQFFVGSEIRQVLKYNSLLVKSFCRIYWNDKLIGETKYSNLTAFPLWQDERFLLHPPVIFDSPDEESLLHCTLTVELWCEMDITTISRQPELVQIGYSTVKGEAIVKLFSDNEDASSQMKWITLTTKNDDDQFGDVSIHFPELMVRGLFVEGGLYNSPSILGSTGTGTGYHSILQSATHSPVPTRGNSITENNKNLQQYAFDVSTKLLTEEAKVFDRIGESTPNRGSVKRGEFGKTPGDSTPNRGSVKRGEFGKTPGDSTPTTGSVKRAPALGVAGNTSSFKGSFLQPNPYSSDNRGSLHRGMMAGGMMKQSSSHLYTGSSKGGSTKNSRPPSRAVSIVPSTEEISEGALFCYNHEFSLKLVKATNLSSVDVFGASDPYVMIDWLDEELYRSEVVKQTTNPVFLQDQIVLKFPSALIAKYNSQPDSFPLKNNDAITISVWHRNPDIGPDYLGGITFSGKELYQFLTNRNTTVLGGQPDPTNPNVLMFPLKENEDLNEDENSLVKGEIYLQCSEVFYFPAIEPVVSYRQVLVCISKASKLSIVNFLSNSSDSYGKLFWVARYRSSGDVATRKYVGKTGTVINEISPHYQDNMFFVDFPVALDDAASAKESPPSLIISIEVEIWDEPSDYFLGCAHVSSEDLVCLCDFGDSDELKYVGIKYPLEKSDRYALDQQSLVGGFLTITNGQTQDASTLSESLNASTDVFEGDGDGIDADAVSETPTAARENVAPAVLGNDDKESRFLLRVLGANDLSKANIFGLSDPYVVVYWNNEKVGQTEVITDDLNPKYENENFLLNKPSGMLLKDCELYMEVFDKNDIAADKFLGSSVFKDETLLSRFAQSDPHIEIPLAPSDRPNRSPNLVKGSLSIGIKVLKPMDPERNSSAVERPPNDMKNFEVTVLAASGLLNGNTFGLSDPYCKVYWGFDEIGTTAVVRDTLDPFWESDESFNFWVPENFASGSKEELEYLENEIDEMALYIDVFNANKSGPHMFLGCIELKGEELYNFTAGHAITRSWVRLTKSSRRKKKDQPANTPGKVEIIIAPRINESEFNGCKEIELSVCAARGLAKANIFGASDPYLKIRWNNKLVGKTTVVKNCLDPVWEDEKFIVYLPSSMKLDTCVLYLEIWDWNLTAKETFLGSVLISGDELMSFVEDSKFALRWFPVAKTNYLPMKVQRLVQGQLELKCGYVGTIDRDKLHSDTKFELTIVAANDLCKVDFIGLTDPFVIIKWNQREIGRTVVVNNNLNPVWDSQHFLFVLSVEEEELLLDEIGSTAGGDLSDEFEDLVLQFEVWDHNDIAKGVFLGCAVFQGHGLLQLLDMSSHEVNQNVYKLGKDSAMNEKDQKYVGGTMSIGCKYMLTAAERQEAKHGGAVDVRWNRIRNAEAGTPIFQIKILRANNLVNSKQNLLSNCEPFCVVMFDEIELGHTVASTAGTNNPVWEDDNSSFTAISIPSKSDTEIVRLELEVFDSEKITGKKTSLGRLSFTMASLIQLYDGEFTFNLQPPEDAQQIVRGSLTFHLSFAFPFWDSVKVVIPTTFTRRIHILSAAELPLVNDTVPSTKCNLFIDGNNKYKTMVVKSSSHPSWLMAHFDIEVDSKVPISVLVQVIHVDDRDKKDVCLGEVTIPFEFLLRPPCDAWNEWLGPAARTPPKKYVFTVGGTIHLSVASIDDGERDLVPYCSFPKLTTPSASYTVKDVCNVKNRFKSKEVLRDEGKSLTDDQKLWLGTSVDFGAIQNLPNKPEWLIIPLPSIGIQIGVKDRDKMGTTPGHKYALAIERPLNKAFSSDALMIDEVYIPLKKCITDLRKKEIYRQLRVQSLKSFSNALESFVQQPNFDINVVFRWLAMAIFQCFPDCFIYTAKLTQDATLLQYTIFDTIESTRNMKTQSSVMKANSNMLTSAGGVTENTKAMKEYFSRSLALRKDQGSDWECIGKNSTKLVSIREAKDLSDRSIVCNRPFCHTSFPRYIVPFTTSDVSLGLFAVENLGVHSGGSGNACADEGEVVKWFKDMGDVCGEVIYRGREARALRNISIYVAYWSSTADGLVSQILTNCLDVVHGCKVMEIWGVNDKFQLRSLCLLKPITNAVSGIELEMTQINVSPATSFFHAVSTPDYVGKDVRFVIVIGYGDMEQCHLLHASGTEGKMIVLASTKLIIFTDRTIAVSIFEVDENVNIIKEFIGKAQLLTFKEPSLRCVLYENVGSNNNSPGFDVELNLQWPEKYDHIAASGVDFSKIVSFNVNVKKAFGLNVIEKLGGNSTDAYCELYWGKEKLAKNTAVKKGTQTPEWNESFVIPFDERVHMKHGLTIEVYDMDFLGKGALLGVCHIPLDQLGNPSPEEMEYPLTLKHDVNAKKQAHVGGTLVVQYSVNLEVIDETKIFSGVDAVSIDALVNSVPKYVMEMETPAIELTIKSCTDLAKANFIGGSSDPFVMVYLGRSDEMLFRTKVIDSNLNPVWNEKFVINLGATGKNEGVAFKDFPFLRLEVWDFNNLMPGMFLGCCELTPSYYFSKTAAGFDLGPSVLLDEKKNRLAKQGTMAVEFRIVENSLDIKDVEWVYHPIFKTLMPCSYLEIQIIRGRKLIGVNKIGGKSDPYVQIRWGGESIGETAYRKETVDPNWNSEQFVVNLHSRGMDVKGISFEVYDKNHFTTEIFMGEIRISPDQMFHPRPGNVEGELLPREGEPKTKKGFGTLTYKLMLRSQPQRVSLPSKPYVEDAYVAPVITPTTISMIRDPDEEEKRHKFEGLNLPTVLDKLRNQNREYQQNPFENTDFISELHYGQLVSACQRIEHTILRSELADVLSIPTTHSSLTTMEAVPKKGHEKAKKVVPVTATKMSELLCIASRYDTGQLPKRDVVFMCKVKEILVAQMNVMAERSSRLDLLKKMNLNSLFMTKTDDTISNVIMEAIFDVEKGLAGCSVDVYTLHMDGHSFLQCGRDTGRPIELSAASRGPDDGVNYRYKRSNPLIEEAARLCRHGYVIQNFRGKISLVGNNWEDHSQMATIPLLSAASHFDSLEGFGYVKGLAAKIANTESQGCYILPLCTKNEIVMGMMLIHNANKIQSATYKVMAGKKEAISTSKSKSKDRKKKSEEEPEELVFEAPESGILQAIVETSHNLGQALFHDNFYLLKNTLKVCEFLAETSPMDILRLIFRTLFATVPAIREISVWSVNFNHKSKFMSTAAKRPKDKDNEVEKGYLSKFFDFSGWFANSAPVEEEKVAVKPKARLSYCIPGEDDVVPCIVCGCFDAEDPAELLDQLVIDPFDLPLAAKGETRRHCFIDYNAYRIDKNKKGTTEAVDENEPIWKIKIPHCLTPLLQKKPASEVGNDVLSIALGAKRKAAASGGPEVATKQQRRQSFSFGSVKEEAEVMVDVVNKNALELVHSEIVRCVKTLKMNSFNVSSGHFLAAIGEDSISKGHLTSLFEPDFTTSIEDAKEEKIALEHKAVEEESMKSMLSKDPSVSSMTGSTNLPTIKEGAASSGPEPEHVYLTAERRPFSTAPPKRNNSKNLGELLDAVGSHEKAPPKRNNSKNLSELLVAVGNDNGQKNSAERSNPSQGNKPKPAPLPPTAAPPPAEAAVKKPPPKGGKPPPPTAPNVAKQPSQKYFLSIATHGVGGNDGWGVIGSQMEKEIQDIAALLDKTLIRLSKEQTKLADIKKLDQSGDQPGKKKKMSLKAMQNRSFKKRS